MHNKSLFMFLLHSSINIIFLVAHHSWEKHRNPNTVNYSALLISTVPRTYPVFSVSVILTRQQTKWTHNHSCISFYSITFHSAPLIWCDYFFGLCLASAAPSSGGYQKTPTFCLCCQWRHLHRQACFAGNRLCATPTPLEPNVLARAVSWHVLNKGSPHQLVAIRSMLSVSRPSSI